MGARTSFLRYRLAVTAFGLLLMVLGALPWLLFVGADGGWAFLLVLWGLFFLPFLWLGANVVRLAWRPVRTFSWREAMGGARPTRSGGAPGAPPGSGGGPGPGRPGAPRDDVIDVEVVDEDRD